MASKKKLRSQRNALRADLTATLAELHKAERKGLEIAEDAEQYAAAANRLTREKSIWEGQRQEGQAQNQRLIDSVSELRSNLAGANAAADAAREERNAFHDAFTTVLSMLGLAPPAVIIPDEIPMWFTEACQAWDAQQERQTRLTQITERQADVIGARDDEVSELAMVLAQTFGIVSGSAVSHAISLLRNYASGKMPQPDPLDAIEVLADSGDLGPLLAEVDAELDTQPQTLAQPAGVLETERDDELHTVRFTAPQAEANIAPMTGHRPPVDKPVSEVRQQFLDAELPTDDEVADDAFIAQLSAGSLTGRSTPIGQSVPFIGNPWERNAATAPPKPSERGFPEGHVKVPVPGKDYEIIGPEDTAPFIAEVLSGAPDMETGLADIATRFMTGYLGPGSYQLHQEMLTEALGPRRTDDVTRPMTPGSCSRRLARSAAFLMGVTEVLTPGQAAQCWQVINELHDPVPEWMKADYEFLVEYAHPGDGTVYQDDPPVAASPPESTELLDADEVYAWDADDLPAQPEVLPVSDTQGVHPLDLVNPVTGIGRIRWLPSPDAIEAERNLERSAPIGYARGLDDLERDLSTTHPLSDAEPICPSHGAECLPYIREQERKANPLRTEFRFALDPELLRQAVAQGVLHAQGRPDTEKTSDVLRPLLQKALATTYLRTPEARAELVTILTDDFGCEQPESDAEHILARLTGDKDHTWSDQPQPPS